MASSRFDARRDIRVTRSQAPLSEAEKALLAPDLTRRGIGLSILDVLPPRGKGFYLLRATDRDGRLLGVTPTMSVAPFVCLKNMLAEGNHVGWDASFYLTEAAPRHRTIAALLEKLGALTIWFGSYFGVLDDEVLASLPLVRHRLYATHHRAGYVDAAGLDDVSGFLARHKRLRRHVRGFGKKGGAVHVAHGPLSEDLIAGFAACVESTYHHHGARHKHRYRSYVADACPNFYRTCPDAVHIYTTLDGRINGCQSFVRHPDRLELSEGGFLRDRKNHHAYEAILVESVAQAIAAGVEKVSYGGLWNATKQRYTHKEDRRPIYALTTYANALQYRLFGRSAVQRFLLNELIADFGGTPEDFTLISSSDGPSLQLPAPASETA